MLLVVLLIQSACSLKRYPLVSSRSSPLSKLNFINLLDSAHVPVVNNMNLMYSTTIEMGTPPQNFSFVLDTGSSYIWVVSNECECHESNKTFDPASSSSYKSLNDDKELRYGKGMVKGAFSTETFKLGDLQAKNQHFVLSSYDEDLEGLGTDGLLGLGFAKLSDGYPTFVENLKAQGEIPHASFSLYLNNEFEQGSESFFTIGEVDSAKSKGSKSTINIVTKYGFWLGISDYINIDKVAVKSRAYALLDIGTSALYGPKSQVDLFLNTVVKGKMCNNDEGWTSCECKKGNYRDYPDFELSINGTLYVIRPESYVFYYQEVCYMLFQGHNSSFWLLGQPLFREYYSVYDMENAKVDMYRLYGQNPIKLQESASEFMNDFESNTLDKNRSEGSEGYVLGAVATACILSYAFYKIYYGKKTEQDYQRI